MVLFFEILAIVLPAGAAGGLVHGIVKPAEHPLTVPFCQYRLRLGFLGDMAIGGVASVAILFLLSPVLSITFARFPSTEELLKLLSVSVLAGFSGRPLVESLSVRLINQIAQVEKKVDQVAIREESESYLRQGDFHAGAQNYDHAIAYYEKALRIDSRNVNALLNRAKALKRIGKLAEAIADCTAALTIESRNARAYYNRACYRALSKVPVDEALCDLRAAIALFPPYRNYAKTDPDFDGLRSDHRFQDIIGDARPLSAPPHMPR